MQQATNNIFLRILSFPLVWMGFLKTGAPVSPQDTFLLRRNRRDQMFADIDQLEEFRKSLGERLKAATSNSQKRRIVSDIVLLDGDLERLNAQLTTLNKQMAIQRTHTHNKAMLDLTRNDGVSTEELRDTAAEAQVGVEDLNDQIEIVSTLQAGVSTNDVVTDAERAVYQEFGLTAPGEGAPGEGAPGEGSAIDSRVPIDAFGRAHDPEPMGMVSETARSKVAE